MGATLGLIYIGLSFVLGGIAASYEIWHKPLMLDRSNGRGKFPSPKDNPIFIALFTAIFWPVLIVCLIADAWSEKQ